MVLALWWDRERGLEQVPELVERRRRAAEAGVRATSVKIMQDGVCETHTAAMLDPYLDAHGHTTDNRGLSFIAADDLREYVAALDAEDFQVHVHALGDRAVRDSLAPSSTPGRSTARAATATTSRTSRSSTPPTSPASPPSTSPPTRSRCGRAATRRSRSSRCPSSPRPHATSSTSSARCCAPAPGSRAAATGRSRRPSRCSGCTWRSTAGRPTWGPTYEPLLPHEALTVVEALAGYTTGSTYLNGLEDVSGRLEVGYAADLVAVDADVLGGDPMALARTRVTHTWADGRPVFEG